MEEKDMGNKLCPLCGGTKCLDQKGIISVYLMPHKISLFLFIAGLLLGLLYSSYAFVFAALGFVIPLACADLRMILYPYAALSCLMGKKLNCPKCEPAGGMFRHKL